MAGVKVSELEYQGRLDGRHAWVHDGFWFLLDRESQRGDVQIWLGWSHSAYFAWHWSGRAELHSSIHENRCQARDHRYVEP